MVTHCLVIPVIPTRGNATTGNKRGCLVQLVFECRIFTHSGLTALTKVLGTPNPVEVMHRSCNGVDRSTSEK
jgi:hypothetical protein